MLLKRLFFFFIALIFVTNISAQEISPYSQYGLGNFRGSGFTAQTSMGRITAAFRDPVHINFNNPASYSELQLTTLEGGAMFSSKTFKSNATSQKGTSGEADFIAMAFPIAKGAGLSFGMVPLSSVNYNFEAFDTLNDTPFKRNFNGSGNIYQLYVGSGVRFPMKNDTAKHSVSIGVNAIYLFGKDRYTEFIDFSNSNFLGSRQNINLRTSDVTFNSGIQYTARFQKKWSVTLGGDFYFPAEIKTIYTDVSDRFRVTTNGVVVQDTIFNSGETKINRLFPAEYGAGFMIKKASTFLFSADVHFKNWAAFNDILNPSIIYQNTTRINAGAELKPFFKGKSNIIKRIHYRIGGWYETASFKVNGKDISQFAITAGIGLPAKGTFCFINIGVEAGSRGTTENNLIKESFVRTYLGFTLNDRWFIKRKYD